MKYTKQITIDKPVKEVSQLLENTENNPKWMEGLQSVDILEGVPGKKGAKSKMTFLYGKREMEMVETILESNLPEKMVVTYESKGVNNIIFISLKEEGNKTIYTSTQEFKMHGFMKVVAFLAPKMFKKQTLKIMTSFKEFAESN